MSIIRDSSTVVIAGMAVPAMWLRDACSCARCRHPGSGQRLRGVLALDSATEVVRLFVDGDDVDVAFGPDEHTSRFSLAWLRANAPGQAPVFDDRCASSRTVWRAADLPDGPPRVRWATLGSSGTGKQGALSALVGVGVLLVSDVPPREGMVLEVARSFGYVRSTNYGDLFDVRVEPQPINLAFTGRAIGPHTDNPYREPVPGIQLLHCLMSSANGGENVLIDGFAAAAVLRDEDPVAFDVLSSTPLTFAYNDEHTALRASGPTIELNAAGDVRGIRWNDRSVEPPQVAPGDVREMYRALRAFAGVLARGELEMHLTLDPGDCIVFDNTRILHARTAFTDAAGARHLQGCYADLDAIFSAARVLDR